MYMGCHWTKTTILRQRTALHRRWRWWAGISVIPERNLLPVPALSRLKPRKGRHSNRDGSDVTLPGLAPWQPATVALLGQARCPGGFHAEAGAARRLLLGHLGRPGGRRRRADNLGSRLASSHCNSGLCRLGGLAQFSQRRGLVLAGSRRLGLAQRALAGLAGYVLGHGSTDKGLTAAPAGGIEAIGGKVSNQKRTSPVRGH